MRKLTLIAALLLLPAASFAANRSACSLHATNLTDALLNPASGEDTDFFENNAASPNVMFFLDSSGSMWDLPPDSTWTMGTFPWGVYGCDLPGDPVNGQPAGNKTGVAYLSTQALFYPPCGLAANTPAAIGQPYNGALDYADEDRACEYMAQTGGIVTNEPGFDPDFYCVAADYLGGSNGRRCNPKNGHPNTGNFFRSDWIFQEWDWSDTDPFPEMVGGVEATQATFCGQYGAAKAASCNACLTQKGFFLDDAMWGPVFTGNWLNMYPPKFLVARKVIKDVIKDAKTIRMGLAVFATSGGDGASLQSVDGATTMAPDCPDVYPANTGKFDQQRQQMLKGLNEQVRWWTATPLAESVLNIGQYFHSDNLDWWGKTNWDAGGYYKSNTTIAWHGGDFRDPGGNKATHCYQCQQDSLLVITDGYPNSDNQIPNGPTMPDPTVTPIYAGNPAFGILNTNTPVCNNGVGNKCNYFDPLPKVAYYLHHTDLRDDNESGYDCGKMTGRQPLNVYTIGFGTSGAANQLLGDTAYRDAANDANSIGGGQFFPATNAKDLKDSVLSILDDINTRSTSFGVASVSTLQSTSGLAVLVPRFDPARSAHWNGHLYRFNIYSEFADGCIGGAADPKDVDHDGACTGVYLKDQAGDFISEDGTGSFRKNNPGTQVLCKTNPAPYTGTGNPPCAPGVQAGPGGLAIPTWEAGAVLAAKRWYNRKIYTAVDTNNDGVITGVGGAADGDAALTVQGGAPSGLVKFDDTDPNLVTNLISYLDIDAPKFCSDLSKNLAAVAPPDNVRATAITTELAANTYTTCIKTLVRYVMGADIFNENITHPGGCNYPPATPGSHNLGDYCDRPYKLGDIFHSSPVVVQPPLNPASALAAMSLSNQHLLSLYLTPVKAVGALPAVTAWKSYFNTYRHRKRIVLVGANDGMVHAFDDGAWVPGDDPSTTSLDESKVVDDNPPFPAGPRGYYQAGTGDELWAFIPPDLLPKLPLFMGKEHQFYVDGTPMVRDVWVDGGASGAVGAKDYLKAANEFHTVAVFGERRGGNHYFGLDVTWATAAGAGWDNYPRFLWIYPQPNDPEALAMGETYDDFLPTPPPIGPVRIGNGAAPYTYSYKHYDGTNPIQTKYEELWVTAISGGLDPQYVRGKSVHLLDVWNGNSIFDFEKPASGCPDATPTNPGDPQCAMDFPVAATPGMVSWGQKARSFVDETQYLFDTITFGDTGGQLWTVRIGDPGVLAGGKVTNWFGGRMFQSNGPGPTSFCQSYPFFYITANVPLSNSGYLRTLAGTGDRFNLLDTHGGQCGADNIRACMQRGCKVTVDADLKVDNWLGEEKENDDYDNCNKNKQKRDGATGGGAVCNSVTASVKIDIHNCVNASGDDHTIKKVSVKCLPNAGNTDAYGCTDNADATHDDDNDKHHHKLKLGNAITSPNAFYSVRVFDEAARNVFYDAAGAQNYDQARLSEGSLNQIDSGQTNQAILAPTLTTAWDDGWWMPFKHCDTAFSGGVMPADCAGAGVAQMGASTFDVDYVDERVASPSAVARCAFWNTMQPVSPAGGGGGCGASPCSAGKGVVAYFYGADAATGGLCYVPSVGYLARSSISMTIVPPPAPQVSAYVNPKGEVMYGLTAVRVPTGATMTQVGKADSPAAILDLLDISWPKQEGCRHSNPTQPAPPGCY